MKPRALIIGAGIAGASAAYRLSLDFEVTVVEVEGQAGVHSTGRSAASFSTTSGPPVVCALAESSRQFFMQPPTGFTDYSLTKPRGLLWIGRDEFDQVQLDSLADRRSSFIPPIRRLSPAECRGVIPQFHDHAIEAGGVFEPDCLAIDVAELLMGYIRLASQRGAKFRFDTIFTSGRCTGVADSHWNIASSRDSFEADVVVNAAGAWADDVARRCGVEVVGMQPFRRTSSIVPSPDLVNEWPLVMDIGNRCYFEPEAGGLLVSLSEETPHVAADVRPEEIDVALSLDRLLDTVDLEVRSVHRSWAGLRTFAPDRLPVVGQDSKIRTFYWIAGQGGAGIKLAPALSDLLYASIAGHALPQMPYSNEVNPATLSLQRFDRN